MELFIRYPDEVQQELFKSLILSGKFTELGKKYGFESIQNTQDFKNNVPIFTYEKFSPYINRVMKGEQQIFWTTPIHFFSKSSIIDCKPSLINSTRDSHVASDIL